MQIDRQLISTEPEEENVQPGVPVTPIPPRASAYPAGSIKIRPRYPRSYTEPQDDDVTRIPTLPQPTMWRYESPDYQAESSLSSLSLVASEDLSPSIDELDTFPSHRELQQDEARPARTSTISDLPRHDYYGLHLPSLDVSKLATRPPSTLPLRRRTRKLQDEYYAAFPAIDDVIEADTVLSSSVTLEASPSPIVEASPSSRLAESPLLVSAGIKRRGKRQEYRPSFALDPLDRIRWWLLYPGRLELLLWLVGTALLVALICVLVFATTISLGIVSFGHSGNTGSNSALTTQCTGSTASGDTTTCDSSPASSSAGLKITLLNTTALLTSTPVHLRGQGFSAGNRVTFTYDNNQPCHPGSVQVDDDGEFTVDLTLPGKPSLRPGHHRLVAYDETRKQSISLTILFTCDTASKTTVVTQPPL
jgi:hypothetical protein